MVTMLKIISIIFLKIWFIIVIVNKAQVRFSPGSSENCGHLSQLVSHKKSNYVTISGSYIVIGVITNSLVKIDLVDN